MKKWKKRILAFVMALAVAEGGVDVRVYAEGTEGVTEEGLRYFINEDDSTVTITGYSGSRIGVEIPLSIEGIPVTAIADKAFYGCRKIPVITIPDSVISIGNKAFEGCNLETVTIPDSVTSLGNNIFSDCDRLSSIVLSSNVNLIPDAAFENCDSLNNIMIPENITSIGAYSFSWCDGLTNITIPDSVTLIGDGAFMECSNLNEIRLSKNITSIGAVLFSGCRHLKKIALPEGLISIDFNAFENCSQLTSLSIPEGVISLNQGIFWGCTSLKNVYVPQSVTDIATNAFTESMESNTINKNITIYGIRGSYAQTYAGQMGISFSLETYPCEHPGLTEWIIETEPTCAKKGSKIKKCEKCGEVVNSAWIPSLEHTFSDWTIDIQPTCTEKGKRSRVCTICNGKEAESLDALGIARDYKITIEEPTCKKSGYKWYVCLNCGDSYSKDLTHKCIECNGRGYIGEICNSCKGSGKRMQTSSCTSCGGSGKRDNSEEKSCGICHGTGMYFSTSLQQKVSCKACNGTGKFTYTKQVNCSSCEGKGKKSEVVICSNCDGKGLAYAVYCAACFGEGKILDEGKHKCDSWTVIKTATCMADGVRTGKCLVCESEVTEMIPKIEHHYVTTDKYGVIKEKCSVCGKERVTTGDRPSGESPEIVKIPANVKAVSVSYNSNKITWKRDSAAMGYEIYRSTSKNGSYKKIKTITPNSVTSYTDKNLATGKNYYYKIKAYKKVSGTNQYSNYSKVVSAKPVLAKASIVSVKKIGSKKLIVKWKKVKGADGYEIYCSTSKKGKYRKVKTIANGKTLSYKDMKLTKGKTYYYKIKSYRKVNKKKVYSSFSDVKSCKVNRK